MFSAIFISNKRIEIHNPILRSGGAETLLKKKEEKSVRGRKKQVQSDNQRSHKQPPQVGQTYLEEKATLKLLSKHPLHLTDQLPQL